MWCRWRYILYTVQERSLNLTRAAALHMWTMCVWYMHACLGRVLPSMCIVKCLRLFKNVVICIYVHACIDSWILKQSSIKPGFLLNQVTCQIFLHALHALPLSHAVVKDQPYKAVCLYSAWGTMHLHILSMRCENITSYKPFREKHSLVSKLSQRDG